ncbi:hypothetical protein Q7P35_003017 [Cladosporium inversicolor]
MFGSHVLHGLPSGESDDKHQQVQADKALAHSLASMPAGLEVVPRHHTHFQQAEKEIVQELPEAISQDGKEVLGILAPPHKILAPSETRQAERRRCGLKPRYFYATMASLVVVLALIVGLGSGLGTRRSRVSSNCDPSILDTSNSIVSLLESGISGTVKDQEDAGKRFTIAMTRQLRLENPDKNVLTFRDTGSVVHFDKNAAQCRTKLDLGLGFSPEYETYVFEYGQFTLVGPGDHANWCFDGNYTQVGKQSALPGNELQPAAPKAPALPPPSPARLDPSNIDGNYFVNCSNSDGSTSSLMAYYAQLNPGHNVGHPPNQDIVVKRSTYIDWTQPSAVTFPNTSITVHWSVLGGSETHAINSTVGTANNGYEYFWTYKDAEKFIYEDGNWTCNSEFWAY